jgi:hypothetical protein
MALSFMQISTGNVSPGVQKSLLTWSLNLPASMGEQSILWICNNLKPYHIINHCMSIWNTICDIVYCVKMQKQVARAFNACLNFINGQ